MQVLFEMKLQAIRSKGRAARLFVNVPLALAAALDMQPGERLRWQLLNRSDLRLIRLDTPASKKPRRKTPRG
jgi:hypothetical protein